MCKNAILLSKNDMNMAESLKMICREKKVNLAYCRNLPELINVNNRSMPEVIFCDEESINFDYDLFIEFKNSKLFHIPKLVIVSKNVEEIPDYDFVIKVDKNNYIECCREILDNISEKQCESLSENKRNEIRKSVSNYLNDLGLTTNYLGYGYIKELVVDIIEDKRRLKSFNSKLYPTIAMRFNTAIINIERNIRNAINVAIKSCKNKELYADIMKFSKIRNQNKVPSNKKFITWIAEKVEA